jgi:hypothetical protein
MMVCWMGRAQAKPIITAAEVMGFASLYPFCDWLRQDDAGNPRRHPFMHLNALLTYPRAIHDCVRRLREIVAVHSRFIRLPLLNLTAKGCNELMGVSAMRRIVGVSLAVALAFTCLTPPPHAYAQIGIGVSISVDVVPPPLPVYVQPPIPAPGYIWVPGYWAWDDDIGYYWVPGTWVEPPEPELLWTPPYWGWDDGVYIFHAGYWGPTIGFYGGIAYGCGYTGSGYEGGYWRGHDFFYNRSVNNITNVSITNVYNKTVVNHTVNVSYNGGPGGTTVKPTPEQIAAAKEKHVAPTAAQTQHIDTARKDPALHLANNHGHPTVAATAHPGQFKGEGVVAAKPGKPVFAPPPHHALLPGTKLDSAGKPGTPQAPSHLKNAQPPAAKPQIAAKQPVKPLVAPQAKPQPKPQMAKRAPPPPVHAAKPRPVQVARPAPPPHRPPPPPHVSRPAAPPRRPPPPPRRPPPPPRPHPAPQKHR